MMTSDSTYEAILDAARARFGQEGYQNATIRSIAADAGYSPAMVMKLMGSKERLFALAVPQLADEVARRQVPKAGLGAELAGRIFARRRQGVKDPWAMAPLIIQSSPDPAALRAEMSARYVANMAAMIGDTTPDHRHSRAVVAMLLGIGAAVHHLDAFADLADDESVRLLGELVQIHIDRCEGPRSPLPDEVEGTRAASARAAGEVE